MVVFVARRLATPDGVAAASAVWQEVFAELGWSVVTVAGTGSADHLLPVLDGAADPAEVAALGRLADLFVPADLVVLENLGAVPVVTSLLRGHRAVLRHHDLPWQDAAVASLTRPVPAQLGDPAARADRSYVRLPDDQAWQHVTINERSRLELAARGITACTIYHMFDPDPRPGRRDATRSALGVGDGERLLLQPTRGATPKNVAGGLLLASALRAAYWLLGQVDPSYQVLFDQLVGESRARVVAGATSGSGASGITLDDAYAASDVVALPSTWEGFGNGAVESALRGRPFAAGRYPVAAELRRYGFSWFDCQEPAPIARFLDSPDPFVTERNEKVARLRFSTDQLPERLTGLLTRQ